MEDGIRRDQVKGTAKQRTRKQNGQGETESDSKVNERNARSFE